jgi:hypothetical protein
VVCADDLAHVFRVEPGRQRRRADEIAEHDRELAALCRHLARHDGRPNVRRRGSEVPDRFEQAFAVTERDAELLEVALGQLRQHLGVDFALAERGLILTQAKASQPTSEIHHRVLTGSGLMIL